VGEGQVGDVPQDALWRIFSMTKPLVSVAAMQLVEECRLGLHMPVSHWLPDFASMQVVLPDGHREPARSQMTIRQLLCHMAGLTYGFQGDTAAREYAAAGVLEDDSVSLQEQCARIASLPLALHPGTGWRYSVATDVLAAVLEIETGQPIGDVLRNRLFTPLGMENTGLFVPEAERSRIMAMHGSPLPPGFPKVPPLNVNALHPPDNPDYGRGGHGLFSTLADYSRFAEALLATAQGQGGGPVAPRTLLAMCSSQVSGNHLPLRIDLPFDTVWPGLGGFGFGLGFAVDLGGAQRNLLGYPGAFGWSGAADTWFTIDPDGGFYAVFMAQDLDPGGSPADFQTLLHAAVVGL